MFIVVAANRVFIGVAARRCAARGRVAPPLFLIVGTHIARWPYKRRAVVVAAGPYAPA